MSFKKNLVKYRLLESGLGSGRLQRLLKRLAVFALVAGIVLVICTVALVSYSISKVSNMVASKPDTDLVALQHLIQEKTIVLSPEQKNRMSTFLQDLTKSGKNSAQAKALKEKIWGILTPEQVKAAKDWKASMEKSAGSLLEESKAPITEGISKATGIPAEKLQKPIESLSAWWQLRGQQSGSAEKLLKEVEGR